MGLTVKEIGLVMAALPKTWEGVIEIIDDGKKKHIPVDVIRTDIERNMVVFTKDYEEEE